MNKAIVGDGSAHEEDCYITKQRSVAGRAVPRRLWHRMLAFSCNDTSFSSTFSLGTSLDCLPVPHPENILSNGDLQPEVKL